MAPIPPTVVGSESRAASSELETTSQESTSDPLLESRVCVLEKDMLYIKEVVDKILRNQIYGPSRDGRATPTGLFTPVSGGQFQTPTSPLVASESIQREALLPSPTVDTQLKYTETRYATSSLEHVTGVTPSIDLLTKPLDLPLFERKIRIPTRVVLVETDGSLGIDANNLDLRVWR